MTTGKKSIILMIVICCIQSSFSYNSDYEAAVPTLNLPLGAREIAMGDVGVTIARSEVGAYWNPALMGVKDVRLQYGTAFCQLGKPNQYYSSPWLAKNHNNAVGLSYQFPKNSAGGFNLSLNHNFFELKQLENSFKKNGHETIYSFTWGFGFQKIGLENHTFGVTAKYIRSVIPYGEIWGNTEKIGRTVALDLGYLWKICSRFSAGLHFANMGPRIYYVSRSQMDPLPFKGELGIGFHDNTILAIVPVTISAEYKVSRFFVRYGHDVPDRFYEAITTSWTKNSNEENWRSILHNFGYEITLYNHLHLRQGFFIDTRYGIGEKEMHWGFGGTFLNHISIDFYHIYSPKTTPEKHGAWGLTGTIFNIGKWSGF
jgi:hypothetical protein